MNETCSCGRPRKRGTFCKVCYPEQATPVDEQQPKPRAHPNTMIGRP